MSFQSDIIQLEAAVQTSAKEIKVAETQTAEVGFVAVSCFNCGGEHITMLISHIYFCLNNSIFH